MPPRSTRPPTRPTGPWFFFVAVNPITGETKYGTTLDEHNANVAELNAYCKAKPQDCGQ